MSFIKRRPKPVFFIAQTAYRLFKSFLAQALFVSKGAQALARVLRGGLFLFCALFFCLPAFSQTADFVDHYKVLGVDRSATLPEIKKAHREQMQKWHPDHNADNLKEAGERAQQISEAYETLSDPEKRKEFDRSLRLDTTSTGLSTKARWLVHTIIINRHLFDDSVRRAEGAPEERRWAFFKPPSRESNPSRKRATRQAFQELLREFGISGLSSSHQSALLQRLYRFLPQELAISTSSPVGTAPSPAEGASLTRAQRIWQWIRRAKPPRGGALSARIDFQSLPDPSSAVNEFIETIKNENPQIGFTNYEIEAWTRLLRLSFMQKSVEDFLRDTSQHRHLSELKWKEESLNPQEARRWRYFEAESRRDIGQLRRVFSAMGLNSANLPDSFLRAWLDNFKGQLFNSLSTVALEIREILSQNVVDAIARENVRLMSDLFQKRAFGESVDPRVIIESLREAKTMLDNSHYENLRSMTRAMNPINIGGFIKSFGPQFVFFQVALGGSIYRRMMTDPVFYGADRNPGLLEQTAHHSISPLGIASLYVFIAASSLASRGVYRLGRAMDGRALGGRVFSGGLLRLLSSPMGLTGGFLVSTIMEQAARDPDITKCVKEIFKDEENPSADLEEENSSVDSDEENPSADLEEENSSVDSDEENPSADLEEENSSVDSDEENPSADLEFEPYVTPCQSASFKWTNSEKWRHFAVDAGLMLGSFTASHTLIRAALTGLRATGPTNSILLRGAKILGRGTTWLHFTLNILLFMEIHEILNGWIGEDIKQWLSAGSIKTDLEEAQEMKSHIHSLGESLQTAQITQQDSDFTEALKGMKDKIQWIGYKFREWINAGGMSRNQSSRLWTDELNRRFLPYENSSVLLKDLFLHSRLPFHLAWDDRYARPWDSDQELKNLSSKWDSREGAVTSVAVAANPPKDGVLRENYCETFSSLPFWNEFCSDEDKSLEDFLSEPTAENSEFFKKTAPVIYDMLSDVLSSFGAEWDEGDFNIRLYMGAGYDEMFSSDPRYSVSSLPPHQQLKLAVQFMRAGLSADPHLALFRFDEISRFQQEICDQWFPQRVDGMGGDQAFDDLVNFYGSPGWEGQLTIYCEGIYPPEWLSFCKEDIKNKLAFNDLTKSCGNAVWEDNMENYCKAAYPAYSPDQALCLTNVEADCRQNYPDEDPSACLARYEGDCKENHPDQAFCLANVEKYRMDPLNTAVNSEVSRKLLKTGLRIMQDLWDSERIKRYRNASRLGFIDVDVDSSALSRSSSDNLMASIALNQIAPFLDIFEISKRGERYFHSKTKAFKEALEGMKDYPSEQRDRFIENYYKYESPYLLTRNLLCGGTDERFQVPQIFPSFEPLLYNFNTKRFNRLDSVCANFPSDKFSTQDERDFHRVLFDHPVQIPARKEGILPERPVGSFHGRRYENLYQALESQLRRAYSSSHDIKQAFFQLSKDQLGQLSQSARHDLESLTEEYYKGLVQTDGELDSSADLEAFSDYYHPQMVLSDFRSFQFEEGFSGLEIGLFQVNYWMETLRDLLSFGERNGALTQGDICKSNLNNNVSHSLNSQICGWRPGLFDEDHYEKVRHDILQTLQSYHDTFKKENGPYFEFLDKDFRETIQNCWNDASSYGYFYGSVLWNIYQESDRSFKDKAARAEDCEGIFDEYFAWQISREADSSRVQTGLPYMMPRGMFLSYILEASVSPWKLSPYIQSFDDGQAGLDKGEWGRLIYSVVYELNQALQNFFSQLDTVAINEALRERISSWGNEEASL